MLRNTYHISQRTFSVNSLHDVIQRCALKSNLLLWFTPQPKSGVQKCRHCSFTFLARVRHFPPPLYRSSYYQHIKAAPARLHCVLCLAGRGRHHYIINQQFDFRFVAHQARTSNFSGYIHSLFGFQGIGVELACSGLFAFALPGLPCNSVHCSTVVASRKALIAKALASPV